MKIGVVHRFYSGDSPSGEDVAVLDQVALLRQLGYEVFFVTATEVPRHKLTWFVQLLSAGVRVATGVGRNPLEALERENVDLVHIHNLFPFWGTSWVSSLKIPVVATMHNFRNLCSQGSFLRENQKCFDCLSRSSLISVPRGCYRGSKTATIPLALQNLRPPMNRHFFRALSAVIALSETASNLYVQAGVPPHLIQVIPNFAPGLGSAPSPSLDRRGFVWGGRVSSEKGIEDVLANWPISERLMVFGNGPVLESARRNPPVGVEFYGMVSPEKFSTFLGRAKGHIFSSRMVENCPLVYLQALRSGTPTISIADNFVGNDVQRFNTGVTISSFQEIEKAVKIVDRDFNLLSFNSTVRFDDHFSPEVWGARIGELYLGLI